MSDKTFINSYASRIIATLVALATIVSMTIIAAPISQAQVQTTQATPIMDGDLISVDGDPDIYIVKLVGAKKFRRLILNPTIFDSYGHLRWDNVKTVSPSTLNSYALSDLVREIYPDGRLVNGRVYRLFPRGDVGTKRYVNLTTAQFTQVQDADAIYAINHLEAGPTFYAMGPDLTAADYPQLSGGTTPTTPTTGQPGTPTTGQPGTPTTPTPTTPTTTPGTPTAPTTPTTQIPANQQGLEGDISVSLRTSPNNVDLFPGGEEDVLAFRVEAEDSPMTIERIYVYFSSTNRSHRPSRVFESVKLMSGSKEYAEVDGDDFVEKHEQCTNCYRVAFERLDIVVPKDRSMDFQVAVMVQDDPNSTYLGSEWTVQLGDNAVRARDTLPSRQEADVSGERTFEIKQAKAELELSLDDDETPRASVVVGLVEEDESTDRNILVFNIENDGKATAEINELKVKLQFRNSADAVSEGTGYNADLSKVVNSLTLLRGSTVLDEQETPDDTTTETGVRNTAQSWVIVTFELDDPLMVRPDANVELKVRATFGEIDPTSTLVNYQEGTRVKAIVNDSDSLLGGVTNGGDVVYASGDDVDPDDISGVVNGRSYELHKIAPEVTLVGGKPSLSGTPEESRRTAFTLDIRAQGGKIYLKKVGTACGTGDSDALFTVALTNRANSNIGALTCDIPQYAGDPNEVTIGGDTWIVVEEGETQRVELSTTVRKSSSAGYFNVALQQIRWRTSDAATGVSTQSTSLSEIESVRADIDAS